MVRIAKIGDDVNMTIAKSFTILSLEGRGSR
jgi:hypothetical protein